ncbi:Hypothetical protein SRAE_2000170100 [Strongyloides ratti]|uniref:Uncharacterized protein n=1 Tax=Strongyloides ratti TaxID=34506 RepID=A0A090LB78_STRRB|nr:Hypothetical protein SRAE_2000170100 [Strongyloides ratti]CEF67036.1 Hypothetical protein SRAE_2000170100 [Strongyloides ratti]
MEHKVRQVEKIKCLEKALLLLKYKKEILSYSSSRSLSDEFGEKFNLMIEFEIPTDLATETEATFVTSIDSNYSKTSTTPAKKNPEVPTSTSTSTSTTTTESSLISGKTKEKEKPKNDVKQQTKDTTSVPSGNRCVEVKVYLRSYLENNRNDGVLERYDIELNPYKDTLKDIIKVLLPKKDPLQVMRDGVYFTRNDFDAGIDYNKEQKWLCCFPYEMYIPLVRIYSSIVEKEFKMSFVIDDIKKV